MADRIVEAIRRGTPSVTLSALSESLVAGRVTSETVVEAYLARYREDEAGRAPVNGYVEFFDSALEAARTADRLRRDGDARPLLGVPLAVKDNIHIRGERLTCASRILQSYRAPYSATVVERLASAGVVFLGRTNMDEFAMGSSCEYSVYGPSRNPADRTRVCGGSSGGSAAVVAAGHAPFALGSDTGGSVRLPAAYCGVYGFKPTYGVLSRYGLVAFGSSLDQIGFLARHPDDLASVLAIAGGRDPRDETSVDFVYEAAASSRDGALNLDGRRVGVPEQLVGDALDPEVARAFDAFVARLADLGASVEHF